jgi:hypothetical protein
MRRRVARGWGQRSARVGPHGPCMEAQESAARRENAVRAHGGRGCAPPGPLLVHHSAPECRTAQGWGQGEGGQQVCPPCPHPGCTTAHQSAPECKEGGRAQGGAGGMSFPGAPQRTRAQHSAGRGAAGGGGRGCPTPCPPLPPCGPHHNRKALGTYPRPNMWMRAAILGIASDARGHLGVLSDARSHLRQWHSPASGRNQTLGGQRPSLSADVSALFWQLSKAPALALLSPR